MENGKKDSIKNLIEKAFEVSDNISEFKKYVLEIVDNFNSNTITINIDTIQRNYGVNESKEQSEEAVKKMIELINSTTKDDEK